MELRITAATELFKIQLATIDEKTGLAKEGMELRLTSMNEFRDTLKDRAAAFMLREEYTNEHRRLTKEVDDFRESVNTKVNENFNTLMSRTSEYVKVTVYELAMINLNHEITVLRSFKDGLTALATQQSVSITQWIAAGGVFLSLLALVFSLVRLLRGG